MPDTRLTWYNIKEHLRKLFWVYAAVIAVVLTVGNLLWIATSPRVPENERVLIYMAAEWSNPEPLKDIAADVLAKVRAQDETIREVAFESLMFADPQKEYTGVMVLMTRLAVGEGDVFLADANAMKALVQNRACLPLDDLWAKGWLAEGGLEPYYATVTDEETGESDTYLAGLSLDNMTALSGMRAFDNSGAYLVIAANGENIDASVRAAEYLVEDLKEASGA